MSMRSAIARAALIGASAALVMLSAPAIAAENESKPAQAAAAPESKATKAAKEKTYCITSEITGTRLAPKVCKTRKEWLAEGVDPLND